MSTLSSQVNFLRLMARLVRDYDYEEISRMLREAADTIEKLGPHSDQLEPSRWHELFGTPERTARTMANDCQFAHGGELCDRCQCYLFSDCDRMLRLRSEQSIYDALLEWLMSDELDESQAGE